MQNYSHISDESLGEPMEPTASDLRAAIARARMPLYLLAAQLQLHPSRLGLMLNERVPLPPEMAVRILKLLKEGHLR